jgi:ribosomal protein L16 Arg81 hydroxylase
MLNAILERKADVESRLVHHQTDLQHLEFIHRPLKRLSRLQRPELHHLKVL